MLTSFNLNIVQVEVSSKCTLKCPRCPRTEFRLPYLNQEINLETFKKCFTPEILSYIKHLIFCGHTGDPIYASDFLEIISYVKNNSKTSIRITTNGSYKKESWWINLSQLLDHNDVITFSIDGWDNESNNQYRINSDWTSIIEAIRTVKKYSKCILKWSTIYFSFNQNNIDNIIDIAKSLGCDVFTLVRSSKFDGRYSINGSDPLKPLQKLVSTTNNYQRDKIVFGRDDSFTMELEANKHPWAKCLNHNREINVTVEGLVFPCGWFNLGYQINNFVEINRNLLDINKRPLLEILADPIWQDFINNLEVNPLEICKIKCKNDQK